MAATKVPVDTLSISADSLSKGKDPVLDRVTNRILFGIDRSSLTPLAERQLDPRGYIAELAWNYTKGDNVRADVKYQDQMQGKDYFAEGKPLHELTGNPVALRPITVYFREGGKEQSPGYQIHRVNEPAYAGRRSRDAR